MTKQPTQPRHSGRPLPTHDPEILRRAHRLTNAEDIGALLRAERAARKLSQAEMAARLGISRQNLIALEAGSEGTSVGTVLRILADLGVAVLAIPAEAAEDLPGALGLRERP